MGRILLVEDSPADADLLCRILAEQVGPTLDVIRAGSLGAATARLRDEPPFDCAVLDLSLPDGSGLDSLAVLRAVDPAMPVIVVTGAEDADLAQQSVRLGADDFIRKDWLFTRPQPLGASIRNALERTVGRAASRPLPPGYDALRCGRLTVGVVGNPAVARPATDAMVAVGRAADVDVDAAVHPDAPALLASVDVATPPHAVVHVLEPTGSTIPGLDTVAALRSALPRSSLLVVAGPAQDDLALAALELGADDVVLPAAAMRGELWHAMRLSFQRRRLAEARDTAARRDDLTGLPTRSQLMAELQRACTSMGQGRLESIAVMFLDLDGFKEVNDAFGHQVGDLVLRVVASRLQQAIRRADTVGRLGGDEFLLVAADVTAQDAAAMRRRVADLVTTPMAIDEGTAVLLGASIGVAHAEAPAAGDRHVRPEDLLRQADERMYAEKLAHRDRDVIRALDGSLRRRLDVRFGRRERDTG